MKTMEAITCISLKAALMTTMLVASVAGAVGMPVTALDFSKWANKTLKDDGITDARVIETKYPFSFTYCRKDSLTLWRYDVMSAEQLDAIQQGKTVKPVTQKTVAVENDSNLCNVAN